VLIERAARILGVSGKKLKREKEGKDSESRHSQ
jgi:hypothetical protein